jgi:hypothetical protein
MRRFPILRAAALTAVLSLFLTVAPMPAFALGPPETLAAERVLGLVDGTEAPVEPSFSVDYLSVSWIDGVRPEVRFRAGSRWTRWSRVELDDIPVTGGRTYAALMSGADADAYQVRGRARGVQTMAINTTDGPRPLIWAQPEAQAHHLAQPPVITRAQWGADESLVKAPPTYDTAVKAAFVHHTDTGLTNGTEFIGRTSQFPSPVASPKSVTEPSLAPHATRSITPMPPSPPAARSLQGSCESRRPCSRAAPGRP